MVKKIKGFICYDERGVSFKEYLDLVKKGQEPSSLPIPVLHGMIKMLKENHNVKGYHITSLVGCLRNLYFEKKIGTEYIRPRDFYPAFRGTIGHKVMEDFKVKGAIDEKRFDKEWLGVTLSGKPDRIVPVEKELIDYKTREDIPQWGVFKSHEAQVNLYRWLVKDIYEINSLKIIYITMKDAKTFKVRIWTDAEIENYLNHKIRTILEMFKTNKLPEYEKIGLCPYCPYVIDCQLANRNDLIEELSERIAKNEKISKQEIKKRIKSLTIL